MTGKENIKVGDKLVCTSNEGLMSVGGKRTVTGITDTHINFSKRTKERDHVGWKLKSGFRWQCYRHLPTIK